MREEEKKGEMYVHKVNEETKRFTHDLLTENEKLRGLVTSFQSEKLRLEEQLRILRQEFSLFQKEEDQLKIQLAEIEEENRRFSKEYVEVEKQNSNLANLYVASYRLHGTLDRKEILATIQEIIANLIGSEEMAIFELDSKKRELSLLASMGIDPARYQTRQITAGLIGRAARTREVYLTGQNDSSGALADEADLTACIPLKVDGEIIGAIAIFKLLQQKVGLETLDHELFDLLTTHAAVALFSSGLRAKGVPA